MAVSNERRGSRKRRRDLIFYAAMLAFPLLQFAIFYIAVNVNSLVMAFERYDYTTGATSFAGFGQFKQAFYLLFRSPELSAAWKNTLLLFVFSLLGDGLGVLFSYYIAKKKPFATLLKIGIVLPTLLSAIAMAVLFKYFGERAFPILFHTESGLFSGGGVLFVLLFYHVWMGLGTSVLVLTGTMSAIPESLSEAAKLDGCTFLKELFYITLPMIYPTLVTFLVIDVAGLFVGQMGLYHFFADDADPALYTYGYYLFREARSATLAEYPVLAAMGALFTLVTAPLALFSKKIMLRLGPSTE